MRARPNRAGLRRDREGANQPQVSHHRRPPALQGYGDSMRPTHVLQAFSSRKGSTAVQIPEDRQPSAPRPAISPSSPQTEGRRRSRAAPEVRPVRHGLGPLGLKRMRNPGRGGCCRAWCNRSFERPSSRLPWSRCRAREVKQTAHAAAWRPARTSLMPTAAGGSSAAGKGAPASGYGCSCCTGSRATGGVASQAPIRRHAGAQAAAMTTYQGTRLLTQQTKRGVTGSCCTASVPGTGGSPADVPSRSGRPRAQSHRICAADR